MELAIQWLQSDGPPYYGKSEFKDKGEMYKAGGRFDKERKLWKAVDKHAFVNMVETGKWFPIGVDGRTAVRVLYLQRQNETDEANRLAHKKAAAQKRPVLTAEQLVQKQRADLGIPDDTPKDLAQLRDDFGIELWMIRPTFHWNELGPKSGLSDARRVLRALKHQIVTANEIKTGVLLECPRTRNARRMRDEHAHTMAKLDETTKTTKTAKTTKTTKTAKPPTAEDDPYSGEAVYRTDHMDHMDYADHMDHMDQTFDTRQLWSDVGISCAPDAWCDDCLQLVCPQFLDCQCVDARWVQCSACDHKYRVDAHIGLWSCNALCKCAKN